MRPAWLVCICGSIDPPMVMGPGLEARGVRATLRAGFEDLPQQGFLQVAARDNLRRLVDVGLA